MAVFGVREYDSDINSIIWGQVVLLKSHIKEIFLIESGIFGIFCMWPPGVDGGWVDRGDIFPNLYKFWVYKNNCEALLYSKMV